MPIGLTLAATCNVPSFFLFMNILETFLRSQCDLQDPCNRVLPPPEINSRSVIKQFFQFYKNLGNKSNFYLLSIVENFMKKDGDRIIY